MLNVINKIKLGKKIPIEVGQFYGRLDDPKSIYLISSAYIGGLTQYMAIMINDACLYVRPTSNINEVFDGYDDKFYLINDLTITINQ